MKTRFAEMVVNDYLKFNEEMEKNDIEDATEEYDDAYRIWLKGITNEAAAELQEDLLEICEDNEEMKEAIKEYFDVVES